MWSCVTALFVAPAASVTLSNVHLPIDQRGFPLITGEASVLRHAGWFYFYLNDWGGCPGIDCCASSGGCASCCMITPPHNDTCVYKDNHSVVVYQTDLTRWFYRGEALPAASRAAGIEFRPCVIWNRETRRFVMWYVDSHAGQRGYAVATATTPAGPFVTVVNSTHMAGSPEGTHAGDFNILVDDDGAAYHVRHDSGRRFLLVTRLHDDYLSAVDVQPLNLSMPMESESPVFFKHAGVYVSRRGVEPLPSDADTRPLAGCTPYCSPHPNECFAVRLGRVVRARAASAHSTSRPARFAARAGAAQTCTSSQRGIHLAPTLSRATSARTHRRSTHTARTTS